MRLLLVDNHDSFTHNLAHRLAEAGARPIVVAHDTPIERLPLADVAGIVISPGPGRPERAADFGVCGALIAQARVPLLASAGCSRSSASPSVPGSRPRPG